MNFGDIVSARKQHIKKKLHIGVIICLRQQEYIKQISLFVVNIW